MHLFFDESGDFGFPSDRFDCYAQAALICPDSAVPGLDDVCARWREEWALDEIHAVDLEPGQLLEVAREIARSDCALLAQVTDTELVTAADIEQFRLRQASGLRKNLDWYRDASRRARGAPVKEIEDWMSRHIKRAGLKSQISHSEFIQAHYILELVAAALQKSLLVYFEDRWREEFHDFHFILDGKLPGKMAAGEKYLNDSILPVLGSRPGKPLGIVDTWKDDPSHPFMAKYDIDEGRIMGETVKGAIDLNAIFEHGLRFEPSHVHGGLQLVDVVAFVVRQAVLSPDDLTLQRAYDLLRRKMLNEDGRPLTVIGMRGATETSTEAMRARYRPLHWPTRFGYVLGPE